MKKLILPLILIFIVSYCKAQAKIDLEKLTFKEGVKVLLKDRIRHADKNEIATTLPEYSVYELEGFNYGPVIFSGNSDPGFSDISSVSFLLNSVTEQKIVGFIMNIQNTIEAHKLVQYIMKKYGKPIELRPKPKPDKDGMLDGYNNFLWKDTMPGYSLVMENAYHSTNKKQQFFAQVFILKNDQPTAIPPSQTALNRIIKMLTDHHKFE